MALKQISPANLLHFIDQLNIIRGKKCVDSFGKLRKHILGIDMFVGQNGGFR